MENSSKDEIGQTSVNTFKKYRSSSQMMSEEGDKTSSAKSVLLFSSVFGGHADRAKVNLGLDNMRRLRKQPSVEELDENEKTKHSSYKESTMVERLGKDTFQM